MLLAQPTIIALPKGRIGEEILPLLKKIDIFPEEEFFNEHTRKLQFSTNVPQLFLIQVRSFDVATFVAFGAAHIGVAGKDVLMEFNYPDIYAPLDLGIGKCRLSIAALQYASHTTLLQMSHLRIATKYPAITSRYFAGYGIQAECIKLQGAMELAPCMGLCEYIVDLVSTGKTLQENGLVEIEKIADISSYLLVNRTSLKTRITEIQYLIERFKEAIHG